MSLFDSSIAAFRDDFRCCEPSDWTDEKCYCLSEPAALIRRSALMMNLLGDYISQYKEGTFLRVNFGD